MRYLNSSELVYVRWLATEALRWRRPRRASRVRTYAPPAITATRRPLDDHLGVLVRVLDGLRRLEVAAR